MGGARWGAGPAAAPFGGCPRLTPVLRATTTIVASTTATTNYTYYYNHTHHYSCQSPLGHCNYTFYYDHTRRYCYNQLHLLLRPHLPPSGGPTDTHRHLYDPQTPRRRPAPPLPAAQLPPGGNAASQRPLRVGQQLASLFFRSPSTPFLHSSLLPPPLHSACHALAPQTSSLLPPLSSLLPPPSSPSFVCLHVCVHVCVCVSVPVCVSLCTHAPRPL